MFLIFSLRRPDILPYTDLGVQKGLLRFALTAHNAFPGAKGKFQLKKKDKGVVKDEVNGGDGELDTTIRAARSTPPPQVLNGVPPTPITPSNADTVVKRGVLHTPNMPGGSGVKTILPPTPFTPGTVAQEVLEVPEAKLPEPAPDDLLEPVLGPDWDADRVAPLGAGLTIETMRSRWSGKKAK
jgi:DNA-3-methyladenine glycosylase II